MQDLLRAVGQPRRRAILRLVWGRELTAGEIARQFNVTFGAVSQHLKVLADAGAVRVRKRGRERLYRANAKKLAPLAQYLASMWRTHLDDLKTLAEREETTHGRR